MFEVESKKGISVTNFARQYGDDSRYELIDGELIIWNRRYSMSKSLL